MAQARDMGRAGGGAQAEARRAVGRAGAGPRGAGHAGAGRASARHCACDMALGLLRHGQLGPATLRWAGHYMAMSARPRHGLFALAVPDWVFGEPDSL